MTPEQKDALAGIAIALLLIQTTERVIKLCMTFVLQQSSPLTLEVLERQEKAERKRTLGFFLAELRKRADLDAGFDALLGDFLEKRNTLVHNFGELPECSLNTESGLAAANVFVHDLIEVTEKVLKVFVSLVRAWEEQAGIQSGAVVNHPFFTDAEAAYKPLVNEVFFKKSDR